jgi:hypothetical protein
MKRSWLFLIFTSLCHFGFSQGSSVQLFISPTFGDHSLSLVDSTFHARDSSNLQIEVLKFYISKIQLLKNGLVVLEEKNSFHLVDAEATLPFQIAIDNPQNIIFDELQFNLGIDSLTNVSGALGGDLDPAKGMYWAWQSGYINFKLEGKSNNCAARNNEFQFHLGGYIPPYYCLQTLHFDLKDQKKIDLKVDVEKILEQIDFAQTHHIMSPGEEGLLLSKRVANAFKISVH